MAASVAAAPSGTGITDSNRTAKANVIDDDAAVARWIEEYVARREAATRHDRTGKDIGFAATTDGAVPLAELKSRIAYHHSPLVESIARRFSGSGEPLEDLVQEGFLGLLSALENYDPQRGVAVSGGRSVKFTTYATHFVAGAIRHFLRDRGKIIKEPAWLHEVSNRVSRVTDQLTVSLGRAPQTEEIAQALNLTAEAVEEILQTRQTFQVAAFASSDDDDDGSGMAVGLVNPEKIRSDRYETLRLPIEERIVLEGAMEKLKALEQKVLYEFFYQDLNQTEIARKFDISCNYVSHILKNATKKMKRILGEEDVREKSRVGGRGQSSVVHPSSGLFTEEHTRARIEETLGRAARAGEPAALLLARVNGMPAGGVHREEAWVVVGEAVRKTLRRIDIAGHAGGEAGGVVAEAGEDLLILLPATDVQQAQAVAARLEDVLLAVGVAAGQRFSVTVGVALYPTEGRSLRDLQAALLARREDGLASRTAAVAPVAAPVFCAAAAAV